MGKKILNFLNNLDLYLGCTVLLIMVVVMAAQVFARYVLGTSIVWSEEVSRYSVLWLTFAGVGYGIRNHLHLEMTLFYDMMPKVVQKVLQVIVNVIIICCYAYLIVPAYNFTVMHKDILVTAMKVPFFYIYLILVPSIIMIIVRTIIDTVWTIQGKDFGAKKAQGGAE